MLEEYGAFDVSLVTDLPLFIDPFLLFHSEKPEYQRLHQQIIDYVIFLKRKAQAGPLSRGALDLWFRFPEVKQNWFGYAVDGNKGHGLGRKFATDLRRAFTTTLTDFGEEEITEGSHLEKLSLVRRGVGRDNVSDLTTNLIKVFLLKYTEAFALAHIDPRFLQRVMVDKVRFDQETQVWAAGSFTLPWFDGDYVVLTPKDILTKDEAWINHRDLVANFDGVINAVSNEELREKINRYFYGLLPKDPDEANRDERTDAVDRTVEQFPDLLNHFIREREEHGDEAVASADLRVLFADTIFRKQVKKLLALLREARRNRIHPGPGHRNSYEEAMDAVQFFKRVMEDGGGWTTFWADGKPVRREHDAQVMFKLVWRGTEFDVNAEVNNGRGPADFKISRGSGDKTIVEFKLASNTHLQANLEKQTAIYEKADALVRPSHPSIKVILFFTASQERRVRAILKALKLESDSNVVLIDARDDNKPSASKARGSERYE